MKITVREKESQGERRKTEGVCIFVERDASQARDMESWPSMLAGEQVATCKPREQTVMRVGLRSRSCRVSVGLPRFTILDWEEQDNVSSSLLSGVDGVWLMV